VDARSRTLRLVLTASWAVAVAVVSRPARATPVTWLDAVRRATASAPAVAVGAARTEEVRRGEGVAGMIPNPTVTIGSYVQSARLYTAVAVPLPIFGQIGMAGDAARARTGEARAQQRVTQFEAGLVALQAWIDLWSAQATLRTASANTERLARLAEAARELVAHGQRPRLDQVSATAEAAAARADEEAARHAVAAAQAVLAARLGDPPNAAPPDAAGDPPGAQRLPTLANVVSASDRHPAIDVLRARARAAMADAALEERLRVPTPVLTVAGYMLRPNDQPPDLLVTLGFELPIFNQRGPLIDRARARAATARTEADALATQLHADVRAAWELYQGARARTETQLADVLPAATEAATLAAEAYRAGRLDLTGLLAAEQRRLLAQVRTDQSIADRGRAVVALLRAMGTQR
jgi:cobalt-zinc-cadmium efflux system outer membrane protein